ncbi:hypothetical protein D3C76_77950 [compost metagenome]
MSDDKKNNVFSVVPKINAKPALPTVSEQYIEHRDELIDRIMDNKRHIIITIDDDGLPDFITNMDMFASNFFMDKIKNEIQMNYDEELFDKLEPDIDDE